MVNKCVRLFRLALIALGISALSLFAIPLAKEQKAVQFTLAGVFWVSFLAELILLAIGNGVRKKIEQISPHMKQKREFGKIGLFCFLQNKEAAVVDILLLVSIIYLAFVSLLRADSTWLVLIGIIASFMSFHLHCILNGILYKSIKHYQIVIHKRRERK